MLEVLRGAAAATLAATYPALASMFLSLLGPLLTLHCAFKHVSPVVALLLKLADDIVESLSVYMEAPQQKEQVLGWTLQLLMQYRDSNLWQVGRATGSSRGIATVAASGAAVEPEMLQLLPAAELRFCACGAAGLAADRQVPQGGARSRAVP